MISRVALIFLASLTPYLAAGRPPERAASPPPSPALAPVTATQLEKSIARGVDFLLQHQNREGSWGSAHQTKDLNIFAPVPGAHQAFRAATTAMCLEALLETGAVTNSVKARKAYERATDWLIAHLPEVRRADAIAIYNVWAHAYGIQALVAVYRAEAADSPRRAAIHQVITNQFDRLQRYESVDGGWGYYDFRVGAKRPTSDSTSFVNATVLIALHEAKSIGIEPPATLVKRALDATGRMRQRDFSYLYDERLKNLPGYMISRPGGSLGRSQACNLALAMWGDTTITQTVITNWLDHLVTRNGWLSIGRKRPVPHESWFQVAGYFYYYGHYYAAWITDLLPPELATHYRAQLAALLCPIQEKDGSWFDFPFYDYHQPYGTAFALMSLARCRGSAP